LNQPTSWQNQNGCEEQHMTGGGGHGNGKATPLPTAGWYPDPSGGPGQRYFDGHDWVGPSRDLGERPMLSDDQRAEILSALIAREVAGGGRVESQTGLQAVIAWGRPVNHALNAVATVFTCGLWAGFWLVQVLFSGERREVVEIDPYGGVRRSGVTRSASASWAGANPLAAFQRRPNQ
jgi:hypothetical protein